MKTPAAVPRGVIAGAVEKDIFSCPEYPTDKAVYTAEDCGHYVIQVPSEEFMACAKTLEGSPNSVMIQILSQSMQKLHPESITLRSRLASLLMLEVLFVFLPFL